MKQFTLCRIIDRYRCFVLWGKSVGFSFTFLAFVLLLPLIARADRSSMQARNEVERLHPRPGLDV